MQFACYECCRAYAPMIFAGGGSVPAVLVPLFISHVTRCDRHRHPYTHVIPIVVIPGDVIDTNWCLGSVCTSRARQLREHARIVREAMHNTCTLNARATLLALTARNYACYVAKGRTVSCDERDFAGRSKIPAIGPSGGEGGRGTAAIREYPRLIFRAIEEEGVINHVMKCKSAR